MARICPKHKMRERYAQNKDEISLMFNSIVYAKFSSTLKFSQMQATHVVINFQWQQVIHQASDRGIQASKEQPTTRVLTMI